MKLTNLPWFAQDSLGFTLNVLNPGNSPRANGNSWSPQGGDPSLLSFSLLGVADPKMGMIVWGFNAWVLLPTSEAGKVTMTGPHPSPITLPDSDGPVQCLIDLGYENNSWFKSFLPSRIPLLIILHYVLKLHKGLLMFPMLRTLRPDYTVKCGHVGMGSNNSIVESKIDNFSIGQYSPYCNTSSSII